MSQTSVRVDCPDFLHSRQALLETDAAAVQSGLAGGRVVARIWVATTEPPRTTSARSPLRGNLTPDGAASV